MLFFRGGGCWGTERTGGEGGVILDPRKRKYDAHPWSLEFNGCIYILHKRKKFIYVRHLRGHALSVKRSMHYIHARAMSDSTRVN